MDLFLTVAIVRKPGILVKNIGIVLLKKAMLF